MILFPETALPDLPLFCELKHLQSGELSRMVAKQLDGRSVQCRELPQPPGTYEVAFTWDGLNSFALGSSLVVKDILEVAITEVSPRLLAEFQSTAMPGPWQLYLRGRGLNMVLKEQIEVFIDNEIESQQIGDYSAVESVISIELSQWPSQ